MEVKSYLASAQKSLLAQAKIGAAGLDGLRPGRCRKIQRQPASQGASPLSLASALPSGISPELAPASPPGGHRRGQGGRHGHRAAG